MKIKIDQEALRKGDNKMKIKSGAKKIKIDGKEESAMPALVDVQGSDTTQLADEREFDLMMAEALTLIGRNVRSMRAFASRRSWKANAYANHEFLCSDGGPERAIKMIDDALGGGEPTGILLPSYLNSIAANLRRMAERGGRGDRPLFYPAKIPERQIKTYRALLRRHGKTVCHPIYLNRYGEDFIKKALSECGCDVDIKVTDAYFEPMTVASDTGMDGFTRVAAVQPTVILILKNRGEGER